MRGTWRLVASRDGTDGSLQIHQDARVYLAKLSAAERMTHALAPGRHAWLQVLRGQVTVNGTPLATSDGAGHQRGAKRGRRQPWNFGGDAV